MIKRQYMRELSRYLRRLGSYEREEALKFYEELFAEAGIGDDDYVPEHFASPKSAALEILAEHNLKEESTTESRSSSGSNTWLIIILAILSAPISIPFAITVFAVFFALAVTAIVILFVPVIVICAILFILLAIPGIGNVTLMFLLGLILFSIGVLILLWELAYVAFKGLANWISAKVRKEKQNDEKLN